MRKLMTLLLLCAACARPTPEAVHAEFVPPATLTADGPAMPVVSRDSSDRHVPDMATVDHLAPQTRRELDERSGALATALPLRWSYQLAGIAEHERPLRALAAGRLGADPENGVAWMLDASLHLYHEGHADALASLNRAARRCGPISRSTT